MEDMSKALIIAGSVLISILIISLLMYFARSVGVLARGEEKVQITEEIAEFNAGFEIYEKSLMYGTDVLSCLNKAQNNNQKYVNNSHFSRDNLDYTTREEYLINVEVKIKTPIVETINVYKLDDKGKRVIDVTNTYSGNASAGISAVKPFGSTEPHFKVPTVTWYYFNNNGKVTKQSGTYASVLWPQNYATTFNLKTAELNTVISANMNAGDEPYRLYSTGTDDGDIGILSALLSTATETEQTIINPDSDQYGSWHSMVWKTAAHDFKTRKFKCTGVEYSEETTRICLLKFEEI